MTSLLRWVNSFSALLGQFITGGNTKGWTFYFPDPEWERANTLTQVVPGQVYWVTTKVRQTVTLMGANHELFEGGNVILLIAATTPDPFQAERELAIRFKPLVMLHQEEDYQPDPIQVMVNPDTTLRDNLANVVQEHIDIATLADYHYPYQTSYYLDLESSPYLAAEYLTQYETSRLKADSSNYDPTAYARVTTLGNSVQIQYWFFYYFQDYIGPFNHEGDWELIQLNFPSGTSIQSIWSNHTRPIEAVYSSHGDGWSLPWSEVKRKQGNEFRPIVYASRGAHANYFDGPACYKTDFGGFNIGGIGYGDMVGDSKPIDPKIVFIPPSDIGQSESHPWLMCTGKWGEGIIGAPSPQAPRQQLMWGDPLSWTRDGERSQCSGLSFFGLSPINIHLYDDVLGRHVGINRENPDRI